MVLLSSTFLYESLWSALGVVLLVILRKKAPIKVGEIAATYLIGMDVVVL